MSIKNWIKKICYGANRNSREEIMQLTEGMHEEIMQLTEGMRDEICAFKIHSEHELQNLRQDLLLMKEQLSDTQKLNADKTRTLIDAVSRDILLAVSQKGKFLPEKKVEVITDYPAAYESNDHLHPRGTKNDNTRAPHFVQKCEEILGGHLSFMDLGCSGGGLVLDEILKGHFAIGLEGSDYSKKRQRAEWRLLKDNLFTCDISRPFEVKECGTGNRMKFDVITAWEVLEHIKEKDIPVLLKNIYRHLSERGYFAGTMSQHEDIVDGIQYHHTVRNYDWWKDIFENNGFTVIENLFSKEDLARGNGNPPNYWMLDWGDENSCFIVAQKNKFEQ